jgi:hypothetical protein
MQPYVTKQLVKAILTSPHDLKWSAQGLGMLRVYLSQEVRLHIWDSRLKTDNVSPLHDHPWHLESYIVAGTLRQRRYELDYEGPIYNMATIKCGEGAHTLNKPEKVHLTNSNGLEEYKEGSVYTQHKSEVHESLPEDGTVTIVTRIFTENRDNAHVFWQGDGDFVSAEPRPATRDEVEMVTKNALQVWF